ncbi:Glucose dehydrogenase (GDH) [Acidilobus saccharovorans 345-15]|uniref:Glucose dehydrogenase (GDH) n=1 Tax=Acidilobus saccharovorans (strain DSM 16705 / JCM 18335 / VKM B-2471 / 345-15) TaxID=666510 RepID=D9Q149_ACIS3|nr:Glucose dehydrogenase (GDH) [Acidilobus saccharovorans 345-15]
MKAVVFNSHGGPEVLHEAEVPDPRPGPGEVVVRVRYTSLNRIDSLVRRGYPGIKVKLPHILGSDVSGTVEEVGEGVDFLREGQQVIAAPVHGCGHCEYCLTGRENMCRLWSMLGFQEDGSYAELVKVPARAVIPAEGDPEELGALPLSLLVAYRSLVSVANVSRGQYVLIWGATGGIGTLAIQVAKAFGARVIATTRSEEKAKVLREAGADLIVNTSEEDAVSRVMEFTDGHGADVVIDYVVGTTLDKSLEALAIGGTIVVFGYLGGPVKEINWNRFYLKHARVVGTHTGSPWEMAKAYQLYAQGLVRPIITRRLGLSQAAEAHRVMEEGSLAGKLTMKVDLG